MAFRQQLTDTPGLENGLVRQKKGRSRTGLQPSLSLFCLSCLSILRIIRRGHSVDHRPADPVMVDVKDLHRQGIQENLQLRAVLRNEAVGPQDLSLIHI